MSESESCGCLSRVAGRQQIVQVLAAAGVGPRARCAGMVRGGRVAIDGRVIRDLQVRADPFRERITLDGEPIPLTNACRYLLFHKPYGVICAAVDAEGRPTIAEYVDAPPDQAVGRLDLDSEGLMLLTDDGWLIHRLGHPQYHHPRIYLAQVEGLPDASALARLAGGVSVKGQRTAPAQVDLVAGEPDLAPRCPPVCPPKDVPTAWLRLVLTEGRKRQVRHMTAAVGHPTLRLVRVGIGPLRLGQLRAGEWRELTPQELQELQTLLHSEGATHLKRVAPR